jgi:hypothetical protein
MAQNYSGYSIISPAISYSNSPNIDAFGRLRVSAPFTLFDSSHRYTDNSLWATSTSTSGAAVFNAAQGLVDLNVTAASGSQVLRETVKVFSYQPGKSLLILSTFVMSPAKTNLRQRIGYFGADNGYYLEQNNSTVSFVERTSVSGSLVNTAIDQASWNVDPMNGTGLSGITLDLTKAQILFMDLEWLGVGTVRIGFVINGNFYVCHQFHHANIITSTYITTATLPLRYEITNTGATSGVSTLKQICSTVLSEGGYELNGSQFAINTPIGTSYNLPTKEIYYPVLALRLKNTKLDSVTVLSAMTLLADTTGEKYNWQLRTGETNLVSGGTWVTAGADSTVDYNITGTSVSGGRVISSGFFSSTTNTGSSVALFKDSMFRFQLERNTFTSTPYEMILSVTASQNSSKVFASIDWEEVTR